MATPPSQPQKPRGKRGNGAVPPKGPSLVIQLVAAFVIFIVLSAGYSLISQYITTKSEEVPLSQIAQDIEKGEIASIVVSGDKITATYTDDTEKTSRKETESSFTQTLSGYEISPARLAAVKISIQDESGFGFRGVTPP